MSLVNLLASNAASAIKLIRQYVLNPVIVCPNGVSVPLKCFHYRCFGDAQVSKRVVLDLTQGKRVTTDNIAPGPHEWEINAYVGGLPLELTSRFMPSIGIFRDALDSAWTSRQQVTFFDKYQKPWQVVVEHFEYEPAIDEENALLFRLHLVELNVQMISISGIQNDPVSAAASAQDGTQYGAPKNAGTAESFPVGTTSTTGGTMGAIPGVSFG